MASTHTDIQRVSEGAADKKVECQVLQWLAPWSMAHVGMVLATANPARSPLLHVVLGSVSPDFLSLLLSYHNKKEFYQN